MCVYIHIHIYVDMYLSLYIYIYIYIYIYLCIHVCIYICIYVSQLRVALNGKLCLSPAAALLLLRLIGLVALVAAPSRFTISLFVMAADACSLEDSAQA